MTEKGRPPSPSDHAPEDLIKERDAFIQQFFRKGAQLTQELLEENERLRARITEIEADSARLRAHLASDEAIRELLRKIEQLEKEKQDLVSCSAKMAEVSDRFSTRHAEVESELANLANLYVATSQLHGAHSVRGVLRNLKELLAQFVGAAAFGVYLLSDAGDELVAVATEGVNAAEASRLPLAEGPVGKAFSKGEIVYGTRRDLARGDLGDPAAAIPLSMDGRTVGVIAIYGMLEQKTEFVNIDVEIFKLLGSQAVPALVSARLFAERGRKVPTVQAFLDLED
jgi:hypothetical protein